MFTNAIKMAVEYKKQSPDFVDQVMELLSTTPDAAVNKEVEDDEN